MSDKQKKSNYKASAFERDFFPDGMLGVQDSDNARRALRIISDLIEENAVHDALLARLALLQTFPRLEKEGTAPPDYLRRYCMALCPGWYHSLIKLLTDNELEVFIKNYLTAHEMWSKPKGIGILIRSMIECGVQRKIPVQVRILQGEKRDIPTDLQTRLGKKYSRLGIDFVLGNSFVSRPRYQEVIIGPITRAAHSQIEMSGWAVKLEPSEKLLMLCALTEPYYLKIKVRFLIKKRGFIVGESKIGIDRLGSVDYDDKDEEKWVSQQRD